MAEAVSRVGLELHVWQQEHHEHPHPGATSHESLAALATVCDLVELFLDPGRDVAQCAREELLEHLRPETVLIDRSAGLDAAATVARGRSGASRLPAAVAAPD